MKTSRVPLVAIASLLLTTGCIHPQALPAPTPAPTAVPTVAPPQTMTIVPTEAPTASPTEAPTASPTEAPTAPPPVVEITPAPQTLELNAAPVAKARPVRPNVRPTLHAHARGLIRGSRYRVRRGDNLWEISGRAYGNPWRWRHLYQANSVRIHNPSLIYPGQVIHLPRGKAMPASAKGTHARSPKARHE